MFNRTMITLCAFALALTLSVVGTTFSTSLAQVYNGPGLEGGIGLAGGILGPLQGPIDVAVVTLVNNLLNYVALAAVIAIIVAGLYMILTGGAQADKAKEIIRWTIVGLIVILFAKVIVSFVLTSLGGQAVNVPINVLDGQDPVLVVIEVVNMVLDYVALAAVIAIITAGLYMIMTGGAQADKAKEIIKWTIIGLIVILLAKVIIGFVYTALGGEIGNVGINLPEGDDPREIIVGVLNTVLDFVGLAAVIAIIVAGIWLIVGQGEDESKERAKKIIMYTVAGLVIILLAKVIVNLPIALIMGN